MVIPYQVPILQKFQAVFAPLVLHIFNEGINVLFGIHTYIVALCSFTLRHVLKGLSLTSFTSIKMYHKQKLVNIPIFTTKNRSFAHQYGNCRRCKNGSHLRYYDPACSFSRLFVYDDFIPGSLQSLFPLYSYIRYTINNPSLLYP